MGPEELRDLVGGLPVVVWEADVRSGAFSFVSDASRALLGHAPGRWLADPAFALSVVHPQDRDGCARARAEGWARGDYEITYRAVAADGRVVWLQELGRVRPGGTASGVLLEASGRRSEVERQRFLAGFERGLQELDDAEEVMVYAARSLGEYLGADRCAYAEAEEDEDHFLMSGDHATGLPPLPGRFAMSAFGDGCMRAMRAGKSWVVADSFGDDRLAPADLNAYRVTGIRAVICVPLLRGGRFVAAMAVHQATVRHWTDAEVDLVELIVARCWESIQRTHAGRALRDSEQRHRLLVERATDAIWVLDRDLRFAEVNPAACALLGYAREELIGTPITGLLDDGGSDRWRQLIAGPGTVRETSEVHHLRRADGTEVALELSIQATPSGVQAIGRDVTERRRREAERDLLLQREHEIAETLQRSLLPRELPRLSRIAAAARYQPAAVHAQTGGDWYELIALGGSVVAFSVGDVVGKGAQAAAVMGQLRSALAGSLLDGHGPAAALDRLDAFAARTDGAAGTTCACLTLDWETGELRWAVAGHPPPVVVEDGAARLLPGRGAVLGGPDRTHHRENAAVLAPGASVLLYTDGLVERRDEPIDDGLRRLCDAASRAHALAPEQLVTAITSALLDGREDDVAVLAVRLLPPPLRRRAAAETGLLRRLRRDLAGWSASAGLSQELHQDLSLALGEAAANSVEHAFPGSTGEVEYSVTRAADGQLEVVVRDDGRWRPEPAENSHRGRGIGIMKALSAEFGIDHDDRGTAVRFRIRPDPAAAPEDKPVVPEGAASPNVSVEETAPGLVTLKLTGDLDLETVGQVRPAVLGRVEATASGRVVVDLSELRYLSSCGIALLLDVAAATRRRHIGFATRVSAGSAVLRILELAGLTDTPAAPFPVETLTRPTAAG
ncbi:SpoIIE family protein phosphatase [Amycolatopsis rifamycinica]|uniref:PAS/PAC sensor protein n=1 Tax=Amycolatopsis rifamycinica TaxID=287986 RepID=A0A066UEQ4_9PSEU|nr:SpoIIE family protein phosphatase [Amycolatopsis rifamycinica]KDN22658.1 PAS/PAC sensor protein [Amycolatopsis rifamycinica]